MITRLTLVASAIFGLDQELISIVLYVRRLDDDDLVFTVFTLESVRGPVFSELFSGVLESGQHT
jgi:hypothetical protein